MGDGTARGRSATLIDSHRPKRLTRRQPAHLSTPYSSQSLAAVTHDVMLVAEQMHDAAILQCAPGAKLAGLNGAGRRGVPVDHIVLDDPHAHTAPVHCDIRRGPVLVEFPCHRWHRRRSCRSSGAGQAPAQRDCRRRGPAWRASRPAPHRHQGVSGSFNSVTRVTATEVMNLPSSRSGRGRPGSMVNSADSCGPRSSGTTA